MGSSPCTFTMISASDKFSATSARRSLPEAWSGEVFADRYHDRVLKTPREIYHALRYLFENGRRHGMALLKGRPDPFSALARVVS